MTYFREDLAWAAGLFCGEGCTTNLKIKNKYKNKYYTYPHINISQKYSSEVLDRFYNIVKLRKVKGPYKHRGSGSIKNYWCYDVHGFTNVQAIIAMLWPWLSDVKRQQAINILNMDTSSKLNW